MNQQTNETGKQVILATGISPVGIAVYPYLTTPDVKYNPEGVFKTSLTLPGDVGAKLMEEIDAAQAKSMQLAQQQNPGKRIKAADVPYVYNVTRETVDVRFKSKASYTARTGEKINRKLPIFDARGNAWPSDIEVNHGSSLMIAYDISPFYTPAVGAGVTIRIRAVQVHALGAPRFTEDAVDSFGFSRNAEGLDVSSFVPARQPAPAESTSDPSEDAFENAFKDAPGVPKNPKTPVSFDW